MLKLIMMLVVFVCLMVEMRVVCVELDSRVVIFVMCRSVVFLIYLVGRFVLLSWDFVELDW